MERIITTVLLLSVFALSANAAVRGAEVPFTTLEAENASIGAGATLNTDAVIKVASSERGYAHLDATGEFVQFNNLPAANRLTLRYSIPQNSSGTISLYLNGTHNQDITLTSTQCYDGVTASYVRRYDEVPVTITISAGDNIKLQKDAGDGCAWYGIDLVDLETAPAALAMPANYLSITNYGATGNDLTDDVSAIRACITAAASQGKGVWIPAGKFCQNTRITIPANVDVKGAGIWYSTLHNTVAGTTFSDDIGFSLSSGTTFSDIKLTGVGTSRDNACILFRSIGHSDTLQNLWIQNVGCIHGWEGTTPIYNVVFRNSRVFGTYFDGIHWGDGTAYSNLVENVFFRGMGDDAIAQVNREDSPLCHDNIARFNSIIASYWGRGLSDVGGDNLTMTDNIISSVYNAGMIITTEALGPSNSRLINGLQFLRNTVRKCGHTGHNHAGIHFWLSVNPMQNIVIKDNLIEYGETGGIRIDDTNFGDAGGRTLFDSNISRCNAGANYSNGSNDVVPLLTNNDFSGCGTAVSAGSVRSDAKIALTVSPNPFCQRTEIKISGVEEMKPDIRIYDINGKLMDLPGTTARQPGAGFFWDASRLPCGIYLVQVTLNTQMISTRVCIIK